jgi:hypothetical protein
MSQEVFYRKVGRRYLPVAYYEPNLMDALPPGAHLVCVTPGSQSTTRNINPDHAAVLGALRLHRDAILANLQEKGGATSARPLTKKELAGLEAYKKIAGEESLMLSRPSAMGMVEALENALVAAIKKQETS